MAFIKYYAHTNGATKFCDGLLECGWWCCGSNVVRSLPVTVYELGLFLTTYTIFKFHDGHENFLPYGKHTTMCNNVNQHQGRREGGFRNPPVKSRLLQAGS